MNRDTRRRGNVIRDAWRTALWPVPVFGVAVAVVLGVALPRLDAAVADDLPSVVTEYLFSGGPEAARTVLSSVAGSLITVTSLTFSLTVVTLQLASSQYSPRLLRTFARDRLVQGTLASFLATFVYAITVLRTVRASLEAQVAFVPQVSVTVAYVLGVANVVLLAVFLAHLARQIRVEALLRTVYAETAATVRRVLHDPDQGRAERPHVPPADAVVLCAPESAFLTSVDEGGLLRAAVDFDAVLHLHRPPGEFLVAGCPLVAAWPVQGSAWAPDELGRLRDRVMAAIGTGFERTTAEDIAFGIRQIVDVAVRALSPSVNDPTTAVYALGYLSSLLCQIAGQDAGPRVLHDDVGRARVILQRPDFTDLLDLAVTQPRHYGAADPQVMARLLGLLREVAWAAARPQHRRAIAAQLDRVLGTTGRQDFDQPERDRIQDLASAVRYAMEGRWFAG